MMNWKKIAIHTIPWSMQCALLIFLYTLPQDEWTYDWLKWAPGTLALQMGIFYLYYLVLVPKYLGQKKNVFWLCTVGLLLLYPLFKMGWDRVLGVESLAILVVNIEPGEGSGFEHHIPMMVEYLRRFFTPFFFIPMAVFVRFTVDWFRNYRRQMELESQNLKSELALLRNQVNPHFLFNTLNNIDSMVYKVAPQASDAIVKLSELMRYMLYDANTDEVRLSQEIQHLRSFIDLQKIRLKNHQIDVSVDVDSDQVKVAPMLFIPFVENAFKHGQWQKDIFKVEVSLTSRGEELVFKTANYFDPTRVDHKDKSGGIGLCNVRRRLELLYPDRHSLDITRENDQFVVELRFHP